MEFVAIDVETANADMSSICQIGLARYENGCLAGEWKSYIDPEDYFDGINVSIHGIDESVVLGAPKFPEIVNQLYGFLNKKVVVSHTHFDRVSLKQATEKYSISIPECLWLDSARVARRAWEKFARRGYGLYNINKVLGYEFKHHDALEDAKAAGNIILSAIEYSGLNLDEWLARVKQPINPAHSGAEQAIKRGGNPDGPLYGEILVFTGALEIPRHEGVEMAAKIGCQVASGVSKKTTMLLVGDQDIKRLAGHEKSSKHRKAEELISKGVPIRILRESDFQELVSLSE